MALCISGITFCTLKTIISALICVQDKLCLKAVGIQFKLADQNDFWSK